MGASCDSVCGDGGMSAVMSRRAGPVAPEEWRELIIAGDRSHIYHWYKKQLSLAQRMKKETKSTKRERKRSKKKKKTTVGGSIGLLSSDDQLSSESESGSGTSGDTSEQTEETDDNDHTIEQRLDELREWVNASLFEYGGMNALHYSVLIKNQEVTELLVKNIKVNLDIQMKVMDSKYRTDEEWSHLIGQRKTALHLAVSTNNMIAIDLLCRSGANLLIRDRNGCLPSIYADSSQVLNFLSPFEDEQKLRAEENERLLQQTNWQRDLGVSLEQMAQYWDGLTSDGQYRLWLKSSMNKRELEAAHRRLSKQKKKKLKSKSKSGSSISTSSTSSSGFAIPPPSVTPPTLRTLIIKLAKESLLVEVRKEYLESWKARQQKSTASTRRLISTSGSDDTSDDDDGGYGDIAGDLASMIADPTAMGLRKKGGGFSTKTREMSKREKSVMDKQVNDQVILALKQFVKQPAMVFKEAIDCIIKVINDELHMVFERDYDDDDDSTDSDSSSTESAGSSSVGSMSETAAYESDTSEIIRTVVGIREDSLSGTKASSLMKGTKKKGKKKGGHAPGFELHHTITVTDGEDWSLPYDQFQIQFGGILKKVHQTLSYRRRNQVSRIKKIEMKKKSSFSMWTVDD